MSLCHKCDFCIYTEEFGPTIAYYQNNKLVGGFMGSYKCTNPKSPMNGMCIVGFLGCLQPSYGDATSESMIEELLRKEYFRVNPEKHEEDFQRYMQSWKLKG